MKYCMSFLMSVMQRHNYHYNLNFQKCFIRFRQHVNFSDDYSSLVDYFEKRGIRLNSVDNDLLSLESESGPSTLRRRALSSGSNSKFQYSRNRCLSTSEMSTASYQVPVTVS